MATCITDGSGSDDHKRCTNKSGQLSRRFSAVTIASLLACICTLNSCTPPMLVGAFSSWTTRTRHKSHQSEESVSIRPPLQSFRRKRNDFSDKRACEYIAPLVLCRSTISDETTTLEINVAASDVFNGSANGAANGASNGAALNGVSVNGASNGLQLTNGLHFETQNGQAKSSDGEDIPVPTANGGYSHTSASRAKISAANKGKTPWNKGKARSEEVKARIAEGVRRRNRERFLAKLAEEGITEAEYNERKKAERRKKDAERRKRKTAKGGYTPTEETKKKISSILKTKYANGEIKRKPRDPTTVRRGFKHSEETKQKIRESLKRKWAEDAEYRELMTNKTVASGAVGESVRKRIAETLKKKWEEPEFRASMMDKFKKRKVSTGSRNKEHREKISAAMKKKWMDEEYRKRATEGMAKGREKMNNTVREVKPVKAKKTKTKRATKGKLTSIEPLTKGVPTKTKTVAKRKKKSTKKKKSSSKGGDISLTAVQPITKTAKKKKATVKKTPKEPEPDGSISRLREERRDLYDLLYGDEEDDDDAPSPRMVSPPNPRRKREVVNADRDESNLLGSGLLSGGSMSSLLDDDDDLDDFDPYGLSNY